MATRVQLRRGSADDHTAFTGAHGEVTVNTDDYRLHAHDGSTPNGFPTALKSELDAERNRVDQIEAIGLQGYQMTTSPVKAVAIGNVALTGAYTVDDETLVDGDRYLVPDQTDNTQNGIRVYNSAGAHARATDMNQAGEIAGTGVYVAGGATHAGKTFITYSVVSAIGTDPIEFVEGPDSSGVQDQIDAMGDRLDTTETKLADIEDGATGDMTGAEIKDVYEDEDDTNAFTDAERVLLGQVRTDSLTLDLGAAAGTVDAMTASRQPSQQAIAWTSNQSIKLRMFSGFNTIAGVTLNVDGAGDIPVVRDDGTALEAGDLGGLQRHEFVAADVSLGVVGAWRAMTKMASQIVAPDDDVPLSQIEDVEGPVILGRSLEASGGVGAMDPSAVHNMLGTTFHNAKINNNERQLNSIITPDPYPTSDAHYGIFNEAQGTLWLPRSRIKIFDGDAMLADRFIEETETPLALPSGTDMQCLVVNIEDQTAPYFQITGNYALINDPSRALKISPLTSDAFSGDSPIPFVRSEELVEGEEAVFAGSYRPAMDLAISAMVTDNEQYRSLFSITNAGMAGKCTAAPTALNGKTILLQNNTEFDCSCVPLGKEVRFKCVGGTARIYAGRQNLVNTTANRGQPESGALINFTGSTTNIREIVDGDSGWIHRDSNDTIDITHARGSETASLVTERIKDHTIMTVGQSLTSQVVTHGGQGGVAKAWLDKVLCSSAYNATLHMENGATGGSAADSRAEDGGSNYWRNGYTGLMDGDAALNASSRFDFLAASGQPDLTDIFWQQGAAEARAIQNGALTAAEYATSLVAIWEWLRSTAVSSGASSTAPRIHLIPLNVNDKEDDLGPAFTTIRGRQLYLVNSGLYSWLYQAPDCYFCMRAPGQAHFTFAGYDQMGMLIGSYLANFYDGQSNIQQPYITSMSVAADNKSATLTFSAPLGFDLRMPSGAGGSGVMYYDAPFGIELLTLLDVRIPLTHGIVHDGNKITLYGDFPAAGGSVQCPAGQSGDVVRAGDMVGMIRSAGGSIDAHTRMFSTYVKSFRSEF